MPHLTARAARMLAGLRDASLTLLYPSACRVCGAIIESWRDGVACAACWRALETDWQGRALCAKCGWPLPPLSAHPETTGRRCGRCEKQLFTCARAAGPYIGALRESVLWLKTQPQLAPRLRDQLRDAYAALAAIQLSETIIPVPLHPARLAERGFNQAEIIARALAALTGLELALTSLIRVKPSEPHRAGLSALERARSLRAAFRARAPRLIENRAVLLVDDVMTTASTAQEAASTLLAGGARAVSVLTLARTTEQIN
jgi:competence protein ComFC